VEALLGKKPVEAEEEEEAAAEDKLIILAMLSQLHEVHSPAHPCAPIKPNQQKAKTKNMFLFSSRCSRQPLDALRIGWPGISLDRMATPYHKSFLTCNRIEWPLC